MRFGIINDIHSNVTALKLVMDRLERMGCERIICCGDIIGIGPWPEETVRCMMQIPDLIAVRGNHDKYLFDGATEDMGQSEVEHHKWQHSRLSESSVSFLGSLPYRTDFDCEGLRITVMHWPMDDEGNFIRHSRCHREEDLEDLFAGVDSDIILFAHDHRRIICRGKRLYIDVGSLGCPGGDRNLTRAGVLTIGNGKAEIETIDIAYDAASVVGTIDSLGYPDADFIKGYFFGVSGEGESNNL